MCHREKLHERCRIHFPSTNKILFISNRFRFALAILKKYENKSLAYTQLIFHSSFHATVSIKATQNVLLFTKKFMKVPTTFKLINCTFQQLNQAKEPSTISDARKKTFSSKYLFKIFIKSMSYVFASFTSKLFGDVVSKVKLLMYSRA